ncbi:hypothetical protein QLQ85_11170 [Halomonas sp. M4R5S39]|uniref:hypothetical protein n=1 Tax=Halomonas kalidii TaxID=3043293 RepID=UPI0024A8609B|nr:hypothetical protein [Halomonas kalidii]MDI5985353.1 hypothetical protein [Halomonas kalidii]
MIEYLQYRAKLAKLFRQKEAVSNSYRVAIRNAQAEPKPREEIQSIEHESYFEDSMLDEEISILATDYLTRRAKRRFVAIPSHEAEGMWEQCNKISNRYVLTDNGISELRSSLRKEQKEQVEFVVMIFATLTGVVGAVTGLVAVTMK